MRGLKVTLFILGFVVLGTQTFRHVYVKWIEPRGSALDVYQPKVEEDIAKTKDLDDLVAMYKVAHEKLEAWKSSHDELKIEKRSAQKLFQEEQEIKSAIRRVEGQRKTLFKLWFYWLCGLTSIGLGLLAYQRVNRWLGLVGVITGFSEMACWTSPLWLSSGPQGEFERLLTTKLVLSLVSMVLLIAFWLRSERAGGGAGPA